MVKTTKLENGLSIVEQTKDGVKRIYVKEGNNTKLLSKDEVFEGYYHDYAYDDSYIVTYSRGSMACPAPLVIKAAYNIQLQKTMKLNNKMRNVFEYMLVCKKGFDMDVVLTEINGRDLGLIKSGAEQALHDYLTSGNSDITHQEIVDYVLKEYPALAKYTSLDPFITLVDYRKMKEDLGSDYFRFRAMPQEVEADGEDVKLTYKPKKENE